MAKFIQIIEYTTTRKDEVDALMDEWMQRTEGKRTAAKATITKDREAQNRYLEIVEFPSYDEAMRNNDLPETDELAGKLAKLCEDMSFRNLDVVREELG